MLSSLTERTAATSFGNQADRDNIRKVGISILARTEFPTSGFEDTQTYTTLSGTDWGPFNDHMRRELITTTVLCRNMLR